MAYRPTSHPVWVCGLKLPLRLLTYRVTTSHPVWVCGLKLTACLLVVNNLRHTLYGCVD